MFTLIGNLNVPTSRLITVSGVTGCGKSTLSNFYKEHYPDTLILEEFTANTITPAILNDWLKNKHNSNRIIYIKE